MSHGLFGYYIKAYYARVDYRVEQDKKYRPNTTKVNKFKKRTPNDKTVGHKTSYVEFEKTAQKYEQR